MTVETEKLSGYDELISLLEALPVLVREKRRRLGLTLRTAEEASGVSFNSITRLERGNGAPAWTTALELLRWVAKPDHDSLPPPTTEASDA